jgi:hypothetical protein
VAIVSKPKETPPTFSARDGVQLTAAFLQIMSKVGRRDFALACLDEDLRSGRLGSALAKISPDGKITMTPLKRSDWQQLTLQVPLHPQEGVGVQPYVDGYIYVRRADLDKHYSITATPAPAAAPKADAGQPPKSRRRKPGPKIKKGWRLRVAGEANRIMENEKRIPSAEELAQFCENKLGYQPDERAIQKLLRDLLGD